MEKHAVLLNGFSELRRIGPATVSPDGQRIAMSVTSVDAERNTYASEIWVYERARETARAFTSGPADSSPAWSPDGRFLAFLSARQEDSEPQVYVMAVDGGEARRISEGLRGASDLEWSPGGDTVAVVAWDVEQEPETAELWERLQHDGALPPDGERTQDVLISARIKYRYDGVGYANDRRRHICLVPVSDRPTKGRFVTSGGFDVGLYAWHPRGDRLTFSRSQATDRGDEMWMNDIAEVDAAGGEVRDLVRPGGRVAGLAWSPAGDRLAAVAEDFSHGVATDLGLFLYDGYDGYDGDRSADCPRRLIRSLDRPVGPGLFGDSSPLPERAAIVWDGDGKGVIVQVLDHGSVYPCSVRFDAEAERVRRLVPDGWEGNCASLDVADGRLWCVIDDSSHPAELYELPLDGGSPACRTDFNRSRIAEWEEPSTKTLRYPSRDGRYEVEAFVTLPPGFREGGRYPLLLLVHGGPHGAFGHAFEHEVHYHAGQGRIVLRVNPRGSSGYGQEFEAACVHDWGGGDYEDIMAGVDEVIARGWADPDRMAVNGISYGGYMSSFIITHTDRFACGIPEMLVSDLVSMWGTSDIGWFLMEEEIPGAPVRGFETLWARSPLASVGNCRTPALIIEGEADYRCPIGQGEELYTGLRRQGVEAVLVRLQGASHIAAFVGLPRQRLARKSLIETWLSRHRVTGIPVPAEAVAPRAE